MGEANSHSHESPNGSDMKQGQSATQEVPAIGSYNAEKDPDVGKASPVEKGAAGWPEITITGTL